MQFDQERLRQALLEVEHLRQLEARSRENAEALLEGLELLSSAHSQKDSVLAILSVLSSVIDLDGAVVLSKAASGKITSLAETTPDLRVRAGTESPALARSMQGKPVILANATSSKWCECLGVHDLEKYESVALVPVSPVDFPTVIACLSVQRAKYSKSDYDRLKYFIPLAAHAIRHSFRLAELRDVVAELNKARATAEASARTDPLTGLANRKYLEEEIEAAITKDTSTCFALIDLNGFKPINDNFGHHAGDAVLSEVGRRLRETVGPEPLVARIGGDEFGILTRNAVSRDEHEALGRKLRDVFRKPFEFEASFFQVGASIGIAKTDPADKTAENVLLAADCAMYTIKSKRQTNFALAEVAIGPEKKQVANAFSLAEAFENGEMVPFFQPQFDIATNRLRGLEVLARWQHPTLGMISPADFIPEIERSGLAGKFTSNMLQSTLRLQKKWHDEGLEVPNVSINIAEANLTSASAVETLLDDLFILPSASGKIIFELTERVFLSRSTKQIADSLHHITQSGAQVSLDDFGTGFATLANLSTLPFHEVKIDRQFTQGIGHDLRKEAIVKAIITIAKAHGARVVAEGVELPTQLEYLGNHQCDLAQGFLLGKPQDPYRTRELLQHCAGNGRSFVGGLRNVAQFPENFKTRKI